MNSSYKWQRLFMDKEVLKLLTTRYFRQNTISLMLRQFQPLTRQAVYFHYIFTNFEWHWSIM